MSALFTLFTKGEAAKSGTATEPEVRAEAPAAIPTGRGPHTLEELGVPGSLAREMEAALRLLGHTRGDQITGFTFRAANGTRHALKASVAPARGVEELAA